MKRHVTLLCIVAVFLILTSVASASPEPPKKFRIKGDTTYMEFHIFDPQIPPIVLESEGQSIRNLHGTFLMTEGVIPLPTDPPTFVNSGILAITTKKGDHVLIEFAGGGDIETVSGQFEVVPGSSAYVGMTGTFAGLADACTLPCDPFSDPTCTQISEPDCEGFYVDFTFD
jgi:hypothetical protein